MRKDLRVFLTLCVVLSLIVIVLGLLAHFFSPPGRIGDGRISREYLAQQFPKDSDFSLIEDELDNFGYETHDCRVMAKPTPQTDVVETCFELSLFEGRLVDSIKISHKNGKIVAIGDGGSYEKK